MYFASNFAIVVFLAASSQLTDALQTESNRIKALSNATEYNATEKLDFVTLDFALHQQDSPPNLKPLDKCNKSNNRRCLKFREKKKHEKMNSLNEVWNDSDMLQHPIDEEPRRMDRALGEMCLYSSDCISGCCMLDRETKIRSCQSKSMKGEKCTTAQIKADLYVDICPCEAGDSYCVYPGEFCSNSFGKCTHLSVNAGHKY